MVQRQIICQLFIKYNLVNYYIFHMINQCSIIMAWNVLSNKCGVYVVKKETWQEAFVQV